MDKEQKLRLNPLLTIKSIVGDYLDDYANLEQAIKAIQTILKEAKGKERVENEFGVDEDYETMIAELPAIEKNQQVASTNAET